MEEQMKNYSSIIEQFSNDYLMKLKEAEDLDIIVADFVAKAQTLNEVNLVQVMAFIINRCRRGCEFCFKVLNMDWSLTDEVKNYLANLALSKEKKYLQDNYDYMATYDLQIDLGGMQRTIPIVLHDNFFYGIIDEKYGILGYVINNQIIGYTIIHNTKDFSYVGAKIGNVCDYPIIVQNMANGTSGGIAITPSKKEYNLRKNILDMFENKQLTWQRYNSLMAMVESWQNTITPMPYTLQKIFEENNVK